MQTKTVKVEGMSCEHCAAAVTKAVNSVKGAKKARVDLAAGTVTFSCDEAAFDLEKLKSAIAEAGFTAA